MNHKTMLGFALMATLSVGAGQYSVMESAEGEFTVERYSDGTKLYEAYVFSGAGAVSFATAGEIDLLVVAGGGAGGTENGAGGGAGEVKILSGFEVTAGTTYAISVGAGGASNHAGPVGGNGGDTKFGDITAIGGGGGGGGYYGSSYTYSPVTGNAGGSGGGGCHGAAGGAALAANGGYGNAGGTGSGAAAPGGGGGAGGAGEDGVHPASGRGGAGIECDFSGETLEYGRGGCGGSYYSAQKPEEWYGDGRDGFGDGGCGSTGDVPAVGETFYGCRGGDGTVIVRVATDLVDNEPDIVLESLGEITGRSAVLNWNVYSVGAGSEAVTIRFEFGTVPGEYDSSDVIASGVLTGIGSGKCGRLVPETTYYARLVAVGDGEDAPIGYSKPFSFTTDYYHSLTEVAAISGTYTKVEGDVYDSYIFTDATDAASVTFAKGGYISLLVVGGGGAAGTYISGGGGAGEVKIIPYQRVEADQEYTITIGAGGEPNYAGPVGGNGGDTSFGDIVAFGGGGGGGGYTDYPLTAGSAGGSGGGGGKYSVGGISLASNGGLGFPGGAGLPTNEATGGGGGAGGPGENSGTAEYNNRSGHGGPGVECDFSGEVLEYGRGGCGGSYYSVWSPDDGTWRGAGRDGFGDGGDGTAFVDREVPSMGWVGYRGGNGTVVVRVAKVDLEDNIADVRFLGFSDISHKGAKVAWKLYSAGISSARANIILEYGKSSGVYTGSAVIATGVAVGEGSVDAACLASDTTYYARLKVVGESDLAEPGYGAEFTFHTQPAKHAAIIDTITGDYESCAYDLYTAYIFTNTTETATVTFSRSGYVSLLMVAGGGAGGSEDGAGGGAGEVKILTNNVPVYAGIPYEITIGAGGAPNYGGAVGNNGGNTVFDDIVALGGGGGSGGYHATHVFLNDTPGSDGGSGGGGAEGGFLGGRSLASDGGHGFPGGAGIYGHEAPGGGGGAGGPGEDSSNLLSGRGGPGILCDFSGEMLEYGRGGCGSAYYSVQKPAEWFGAGRDGFGDGGCGSTGGTAGEGEAFYGCRGGSGVLVLKVQTKEVGFFIIVR